MVTKDDVSSPACPRCEASGGCDCYLPTMVPLSDPAAAAVEIPGEVSVEKHLSSLFGRDSIYVLLWALQTGLAAAVTPVATRLLGTQAYGQVIAALAVMQLLFCVAGLGLGSAVDRSYFEENGPERARKLVTFAMVVAVVITVIADATGRFWAPAAGFDSYGGAVRLGVIWAGVSAITACGLGLLKTQDRIVVFAIGSLTQSIIAEFVSISFVVGFGHNSRNFVLGELVAQIMATIYVLYYIRPKPFLRADRDVVMRAVRYGVPLVPAGLATLALYSADRLILQGMLGETEIGRYQIAYNIGSIPVVLLMFLNSVWLPRFFAIGNNLDLGPLLAATRDALYQLLAPVLLGILCGGALVLKVWAPPSYEPGHLQVLMFVIVMTTLPYAASQSGQRALMTTGATKEIAVVTAISAGVNIGINFPLINAFGLIGAAIATLVSYVVLQVLFNLATRRHMRIPRIGVRRAAELVLLSVGGWGIALLPDNSYVLVFRIVATIVAIVWFARTAWRLAKPPAEEPAPPVAATV